MKRFIAIALILAMVSTATKAQTAFGSAYNPDYRTITTAVPFLIITPDSRAGGMGDLGVSTTPDVSSIHWNPAKLAFIEETQGFGISYSPWLNNLVPDISLSYLSYYHKLGRRQALGASMRYFSLGQIQFTDELGNDVGIFNPNEFALDVAYSLQLSDNLSAGVALRYINSNLTGGQFVQGLQTRPGQSAAADFSMFYKSEEFDAGDLDAIWTFGVNISNIGAKLSYSESGNRDFLPTNLRIGTGMLFEVDRYNSFNVHIEANKLLVPTPNVLLRDSTGQIVYGTDNRPLILAGFDTEVPIVQGMFQSFYDAPGVIDTVINGEAVIAEGSVLREELREINIGIGGEYWYNNQFAVRGGYFYEHKTKGGRQYFTLGATVKYQVFNLDFAYLIPATSLQRSPLENTLRFTLAFNLDGFLTGEGE